MKRRTWLLSLGALAVAVLVLREVGVVGLSAYLSDSSSTCRASWPVEPDWKPRSSGGHGRWRDGDAGLIGVSWSTPDGPYVCTARLTRFELEGPCWVPLWKSGRTSFAAELRTQDDRVVAEFEGELTRRLIGPCSLHEFRSLIRDAALDYIEESIADHS
jgi:hypothetical protein